jgi:hypothetical protein
VLSRVGFGAKTALASFFFDPARIAPRGSFVSTNPRFMIPRLSQRMRETARKRRENARSHIIQNLFSIN